MGTEELLSVRGTDRINVGKVKCSERSSESSEATEGAKLHVRIRKADTKSLNLQGLGLGAAFEKLNVGFQREESC